MSLIKYILYTKILNELHLPTSWLYNFVRRQKLKYFGHITHHNRLEKTIMQGMVAGKRSRGKPRQRWEKDITVMFGMMAAASRVAEDKHQFRRDIWAATSWRGYAPRRSTQKYLFSYMACPVIWCRLSGMSVVINGSSPFCHGSAIFLSSLTNFHWTIFQNCPELNTSLILFSCNFSVTGF